MFPSASSEYKPQCDCFKTSYLRIWENHEELVTVTIAELQLVSPSFSGFTVGRELCVLQRSQAE